MDRPITRSPPGTIRKPPSPVALAESPPGRLHHVSQNILSAMREEREQKRKEVSDIFGSLQKTDFEPDLPPKPMALSGSLHVEITDIFEGGTQDKAYYEWEVALKSRIAKSLGLPVDVISITGIGKGDEEHLELERAIHLHEAHEHELLPKEAHELTAEHLEQMRVIFDKMEHDDDGRINARAFIKAMKADVDVRDFLHLPMRAGKGCSDQSLRHRFEMMDVDGSKNVDFEEFVSYFGMTDEQYILYKDGLEYHHDSLVLQHLSSQQQASVRKLFHKFDTHSHGYIDKEEFSAHYHKELPLFDIINRNGDEFVTVNEFLHYYDQMHGGDMSDTDFYRHLTLEKPKRSPRRKAGPKTAAAATAADASATPPPPPPPSAVPAAQSARESAVDLSRYAPLSPAEREQHSLDRAAARGAAKSSFAGLRADEALRVGQRNNTFHSSPSGTSFPAPLSAAEIDARRLERAQRRAQRHENEGGDFHGMDAAAAAKVGAYNNYSSPHGAAIDTTNHADLHEAWSKEHFVREEMGKLGGFFDRK